MSDRAKGTRSDSGRPHPPSYRKAVAGRVMATGQAPSRRQALREAGFSQSVADKPSENGCTVPALLEAYRTTFPDEAAATIEALEKRVRLAISAKLGDDPSDGLLVGTLKVTREAMSGLPEPAGVSPEDEDLAQQLVYLAARVAVARVWSRTRPEPVPELDDEDLRAIRVEALYAKIAAEELAAKAVIPANGDDALDAERGGRQVHLPTVRTTCRGCETTRLVDEPEEQS